jgi:flagellar motor switch protein FliM
MDLQNSRDLNPVFRSIDPQHPSQSTEQEQTRILHLIRTSRLWLDGRLRGPTLSVADLMDLKEDDVLALDFGVGRLLDLTINGEHKFTGHIVTAGNKRGFQIEEAVQA